MAEEYTVIAIIHPSIDGPVYTDALYQWDYGITLQITGADIPDHTPVAFSNQSDCGNALRMVATTKDGVTSVKIPDILLGDQEFCFGDFYIYAWVTVVDTDSSKTVYKIIIPVHSRPKPEDYTEPEHENPFEDTLEQVKQYADQAEQSATDAEAAKAGAEKAYQDTIEAVEQIKEDHMAMAEKIAIKPTVSGTDIVTEDSTDWRLLDFSAQGWTEQVQTEGNQLFDASKLPTKSQGGATVTNNGDGSFTISGSGNLSEKLSLTYSYTHEETVKLIKSGMIYLTGGDVYPRVGIALFVNNKAVVSLNSGQSANVLEEYIEDESSYLYLSFYGESGQAIVPGTIRPILYQDGDGTWEPFSGRYPSPRPEIRTKQLFDASKLPTKSQGGATVTNNGDGSFTISGEGNLEETFSQNFEIAHNDAIKLFREGNLYVNFLDTSYPYLELQVKGESGVYFKLNNLSSFESQGTITKEMLADEKFSVSYIFYGSTGETIVPKKIMPMLYQDGDGEWEPYGTVEAWPQPIVSAAEDAKTEEGKYPVEINLRTAQLFDASKLPTKSVGGATVTNNGDGSFTISGSGNLNGEYGNNYNISHKDFVSLFKEGDLYVKIEQETDPFFFVNLNNKQGYIRTIVRTNKNNATTGNITQNELNDETSYLNIGINGVDGRAIIPGTIRPMLYQDGDGTWEPYKSKSITITSGRPLTKWDRLEKRNGKWGWSYGGKIIELVGTENWNIYNNGFYVSGGLDNISKDINYLYENKCNFFKRLYSGSSKDTGYVLTSTIGSYSPLFQNTIYSDVEEWKTWVKQKKEEMTPLKFAYKTENYEWVELSSEEQSALNALETYYPTTVIINSANMEMQLKYVADPQHYLEQNYQSKLDQIEKISTRMSDLEQLIIKEV